MKKAKERIIYDNWDYDYEAEEEAAKEFLMDDCGMEEEEITNAQIQQAIWDDLELWWEAENDMLIDHFKKFEYGFLVCADLGRWNGRYAGGKYENSWDEIKSDCVAGYDGIRLYDVDGHFYIDGIHHDGTDCFEVKALTKAGYELLDNWNYYRYGNEKSEQEIHNMIYGNNLYSKLIHFAHEVYGCPKREVA